MLLSVLWTLSLMWLQLPEKVRSHARLMSPPSRSSMWRLGFPTKKNFNDNALYCGGIHVQWQKNGGKCGICGDAYDAPYPRDNEAGGKYGQGIISRQYLSGQVMEAVVDVTTNHRGFFEFKLCPNNNPRKEATQECLDKNTLKQAHSSDTKYFIADKGTGEIRVKLQLPKGLSCIQCVFQWTYVAGNNWGRCEDGVSRLGCGPQETFRGCADIAIGKNINIFSNRPNQIDIKSKPNFNSFYKSTKQKYFKDTSISKYPKYALEASKQIQRSRNTQNADAQFNNGQNDLKPSSSLVPASPGVPSSVGSASPGVPSSVGFASPNKTSPRLIFAWEPHDFHKYFENWQGKDSPTAEEIFLGKSGTEQDIFSPEGVVKLVEDAHSQMSDMFHESDGSVDFLKYFFQEPEHSKVHEEQEHNSPGGFDLGGRRYNDFWYL